MEKPELLFISYGECEDYSDFVFRYVELDREKLLKDYLKLIHPYKDFEPSMFISYLIKRGFVEKISSGEWYLSEDYISRLRREIKG